MREGVWTLGGAMGINESFVKVDLEQLSRLLKTMNSVDAWVLGTLLKNADHGTNRVSRTLGEIAAEAGCTVDAVRKSFRFLEGKYDGDEAPAPAKGDGRARRGRRTAGRRLDPPAVARIGNGLYMLNPDYVYAGSTKAYAAMSEQFKKALADDEGRVVRRRDRKALTEYRGRPAHEAREGAMASGFRVSFTDALGADVTDAVGGAREPAWSATVARASYSESRREITFTLAFDAGRSEPERGVDHAVTTEEMVLDDAPDAVAIEPGGKQGLQDPEGPVAAGAEFLEGDVAVGARTGLGDDAVPSPVVEDAELDRPLPCTVDRAAPDPEGGEEPGGLNDPAVAVGVDVEAS